MTKKLTYEYVKNYFTEKILDCFISKTVPVYCGCVNIGDFFNEKGIIKFNNIKECIDACKNITDNMYQEFAPYIEENYQKALRYMDWRSRLQIKLTQIQINKNHEQF